VVPEEVLSLTGRALPRPCGSVKVGTEVDEIDRMGFEACGSTILVWWRSRECNSIARLTFPAAKYLEDDLVHAPRSARCSCDKTLVVVVGLHNSAGQNERGLVKGLLDGNPRAAWRPKGLRLLSSGGGG